MTAACAEVGANAPNGGDPGSLAAAIPDRSGGSVKESSSGGSNGACNSSASDLTFATPVAIPPGDWSCHTRRPPFIDNVVVLSLAVSAIGPMSAARGWLMRSPEPLPFSVLFGGVLQIGPVDGT
jgi:hypothetical protein